MIYGDNKLVYIVLPFDLGVDISIKISGDIMKLVR